MQPKLFGISLFKVCVEFAPTLNILPSFNVKTGPTLRPEARRGLLIDLNKEDNTKALVAKTRSRPLMIDIMERTKSMYCTAQGLTVPMAARFL